MSHCLKITVTATLMAGLFAASQVAAQDRFIVVERGEEIVRVDRESGRVSFCRNADGGPVCILAAEERAAWSAEVEALEKRVAELEANSSGAPSSKSNDDLDKALETAETMMRRFFDMMQTLKKDMQSQ